MRHTPTHAGLPARSGALAGKQIPISKGCVFCVPHVTATVLCRAESKTFSQINLPMKIIPLLRALALLLTVSPMALHAQVPQILNYQGRVAVGAVNFDGPGQFKFALVNTNGTTSYWSNDGTSSGGSEPAAPVSLPVGAGQPLPVHLRGSFSCDLLASTRPHLPPPAARTTATKVRSFRTPKNQKRSRSAKRIIMPPH